MKKFLFVLIVSCFSFNNLWAGCDLNTAFIDSTNRIEDSRIAREEALRNNRKYGKNTKVYNTAIQSDLTLIKGDAIISFYYTQTIDDVDFKSNSISYHLVKRYSYLEIENCVFNLRNVTEHQFNDI